MSYIKLCISMKKSKISKKKFFSQNRIPNFFGLQTIKEKNLCCVNYNKNWS